MQNETNETKKIGFAEKLKDARARKMLLAVIAALFGVLLMPRDQAAISVYTFPTVMAGIAFGIAISQLFELSKVWKKTGMNKGDD